MRKWLGMALAGLVALACAASAQAETKYALCVGINKYTLSGCQDLSGCVNDSAYFYTNLVERGGWLPANMTRLNDSKATKANIRAAISNFSSKAKSGDVFIYQHSSHGDSGLLCTYNAEYKKSELAADLRSFESGVKVIMVVDACYSGSLFKNRAARRAFLDNWDFAGEVSREMEAQQAEAVARGVKGADKALTAKEIGWVTAASDKETSIDFGYYDTDRWLTDPDYESGKAISGTFLGSATWGWWKGTGDTSSVGDKDGYCDPLEFWKVGYDFCTNLDTFWGIDPSDEYYPYSYHPQHTNDSVLRSVELGWTGDEEPSGVRFAPIPPQTATVGESLNYTVVATNSDSSTGKITYSVSSSTAPSGSYSVNSASGAFTFTAPTDDTFAFDFSATNATAKTGGKAVMTVTASLAAPTGLANSGITDSSFTASWDATPGAVSYYLEVFAADEASASAKAADGSFALVTAEDGLTEGEYVIVAENADVAMNNTCSGASSGYLACTDVAVDGSSVSTDDASVIWTLAGDASSCTLFNAAAGMYANPATSKSVGWAADASGAWTLSLADGLVSAANAKDSSWVLQYNSSSPRFACYSSKQKLLRFFRRDGASGAVFSADVGNVTSYTVDGLIPGDYTWRVRAVGNAKGPWSEEADVTLVADPSAPPGIRAIADIEIDVGETATAEVKVSAPEAAPVTSLEITEGDAAATLENGLFSFAPATPGTYDFTITAVNANGSATVSFSVVATLADPETPEIPSDATHESFTASWTAIPGAASYELDVIQGATSGGGGSGGGETALTEDFSGVTTSNSTVISDFDAVTQTAGWSGDTVYPAKGMVRVGKSAAGGYIQTPALAVSGSVTIEWSACSWPNDAAAVNVGVSVDGGSTFTESSVDLTESMATYTATFPVSGSSAIVRWQSPAGKKRFYLDDISISSGAKARDLDGNHLEGFPKNVGGATSYEVTGLTPNTEYTFAFRAIAEDGEATDWSAPVTVKTADGPSAPVWAEIPPQTAVAGAALVVDLKPYVTGSPKPAITADAGTVENGVLTVSFAAAGDYTVNLTAENSEGSDTATLAVSVTDAPVTVPVLTLSNATDSTFDADWTACTGAETYQFQVATAPEFKAVRAGDAILSEDFAKCDASDTNGSDISSKLDNYTTVSGWTGVKVFEAAGRVKLGSGSAVGNIVTPAVDIPAGATLSFKIAKYGSDTGTVDVQLSSNGGEFASLLDAAIAPVADGETCTVDFAEAVASAKIKFVTSAKRAYVDDVVLSGEGGGGGSGSDLLIDETVTGLSYTVTGLDPETTYYARVKGGADWSEVQSIATLAGDPSAPAKYALCVGVNEYDFKAYEAMGYELTPLRGTVNDATTMRDNLVARGGWTQANATLLTDEAATEDAVRSAMAGFAARAKAGDTFVYQHSSHGLGPESEDDTDADIALGLYDTKVMLDLVKQ